jgi:hypothetical protein
MTAKKMHTSDLLARGNASEDSDTRLLADEICKAIDALTERLHKEAVAELQTLNRRRAEVRALLKSDPTSDRPARIREWASKNGVGVKPRGRISAEISDLYDEAQAKQWAKK